MLFVLLLIRPDIWRNQMGIFLFLLRNEEHEAQSQTTPRLNCGVATTPAVSLVSQVLELCPNEASKEVKQTMKEDGQNRRELREPPQIYRGRR